MESSNGTKENKNLLTRVMEKIQSDREEITDESSFYIFISLDIVDSTKIKHQLFHKKWEEVFIEFFNSFISEIKNLNDIFPQSLNLHPWKIQGDEIIFTYKLNKVTDIPSLIILTEKLVERTSEIIGNYTLKLTEGIHSHSTPYSIPTVKATMWLANVCEKPINSNLEKNCSNYLIPIPLSDQSKTYEFIGPDIDLGFRISKFSDKSSITIDLPIAWIIINKSRYFHENRLPDLSGKLKVHDLVTLKGIWDTRNYPIIWYYPNHKSTSSYLKNYNPTKKQFDINILDDLAQDLKITDSLNELLEKLSSINNSGRDLIKRQGNRNPETHCVVICFNTELNKVLLRKRKLDRKDPEKYDCGCMQLTHSKAPLMDQIKNEYLRKYKINLDILEHNKQPCPISVYQINNDGMACTNGIIFTATVSNEENISELEFYNISEIPKDEYLVDGLKLNIETAKKVLEQKKQEGQHMG